MKYLAVSGFLVVVGALTAACSGSTDRAGGLPDLPAGGASAAGGRTGTGAKGGTAGKGGAAGAKPGESDGGDTDGSTPPTSTTDEGGVPLGPIVAITSPTVAADPDQGPVIVNDGTTQVEVVCTAVPKDNTGASAVAASTVAIGMLDAAGKISVVGVVTTTKNPNEYSAKFSVGAMPNGKISFSCSASDKSSHATSTQITTLIDHGPDITRGHPGPDLAYSLSQLLAVDFTVTPSPLAPGDKGAAVDSVTLEINGQDIPLDSAGPDKSGKYSLSVDLVKTFPTPPTGSIPIVITATNKRGPPGVTRSDTYHFVLDSQGPTIVISEPVGPIIGGKRDLKFTVTDNTPDGVDPNTVEVDISGNSTTFDTTSGLWTRNGNAYTFALDSTLVSDATVQITVSIRADDKATNHSPGASIVYYIDNQPPTVDMDPPELRERKKSGANVYCSDLFDPLGQATDDLSLVDGFAKFRAIAYDETNSAQGQTLFYYSGVDKTSVRLYLQPASAGPLLFDKDKTDGDNHCNEIVGKDTAPLQALSAITPAGSPPYTSIEGSQVPPAPATALPCVGHTDPVPKKLCPGEVSDMTRAVAHKGIQVGTPEPIVYGMGSLAIECTGMEWQAQTLIKTNGWVCMATRAVDQVGNVGVSAPLRVCLNDPSNPGPAPDCALMSSADPPPDCTDGCTPPPHFVGGVIDTF